MGYYMRFFIKDPKPIELDSMLQGLKQQDSLYRFENWHREEECADLCHGENLYGALEINRLPPDELDEEIEEFLEDIADIDSPDTKNVSAFLRQVNVVVAIRVLWQEREPELTLRGIDPLWQWLFEHYNGLLHADGEGFYDSQELILPME